MPRTKTDYPTGLCIKTESGWFLVRSNKRYKIVTERVLRSWRFTVLESSESAAGHLPIVANLGFRDGTVIRNISDNKIYLISGNKRLHIQNPDVFERLGFDRSHIIEVSDHETNLHQEGDALA